MRRQVVAVAIAVCISPVSLYTQQKPVFTIEKPTADVHNGPSTGAAIIGQAAQGMRLAVMRDLGSWVKVPWPAARDGVGYVHVSMGALSDGTEQKPAAVQPASKPGTQRAAPTTTTTTTTARRGAAVARPEPQPDPRAEPPQPVPIASTVRPVYVTPAIHRIGLGARAGASGIGFGGTARGWRRNRFGGQIAVTRSTLSSSVSSEEMSSLQFEPSVVYALRDRITDYVWLRPYIGSGLQFAHQTLSAAIPGAESVSSNEAGFHAFGGGELTFAAVPQIAISAT